MNQISVIIPVYNVEQYLTQCIESVLAQTHPDFEVILVDDGSNDQSGKICDAFALENDRVCVIHKANGGVSSARNEGIKAATGQYIMFVDGDDWIEPQALHTMLQHIQETDSDACFCNCYYKDESEMIIAMQCSAGESISAKAVIPVHLHYGFLASACLGLLSRAKTKECLFDTQLNTLEDWEYNFRMLTCLDTLTVIDTPLYHYRTVSGSASKSSLNQRKMTSFLIPDKVKDYISWNDLSYREEAKYIPVFLIYHALVILANGEYSKREARTLTQIAREQLKYAVPSKTVPLKQKIYIIMAALSPRVFCYVYHIKYGGIWHG